ncbi:MAG: SpoIIE family protein phosphatase [Acidobacteriota bacterium]
MTACLALRIETDQGIVEGRLEGDELTLGRSASCDVVLRDPYLSRRHTRLRRQDEEILVEDLGSRNGTHLNGRQITEPTPVGPGDVVRLGGCTLRLSEESGEAATGAQPIDEAAGGVKAVFKKATDLIEAGPSNPRTYRHRLRLLNALHEDLARPMDVEGLLTLLLERAFEELSPEEGAVFLRNAEGNFELATQQALPQTESQQAYSRSLMKEVVEKGLAALVLDLQTDERFARSESIRSAGLRSLVAAPLLASEGNLGMIVLSSRRHRREFQEEDMQLLASLAGTAALRLRTLTLAEEAAERRRLGDELNLARRIQLALLPRRLPSLAGFVLHCANAPSRGVSGDIYLAVERATGECVLMVVDVSGKGMSASLLTASLEALSAGPIEEGDSPEVICTKLSRRLYRRTPPERFATAFLGALEPKSGTFRWSSAGHTPAILLRANGESEPLSCTGMPLGLVPDAAYRLERTLLGPGDTLLLYTDGITEAENAEGVDYGIDRLVEVLRRHADLAPPELAAAIEKDLAHFAGARVFEDDRTLMILRRTTA